MLKINMSNTKRNVQLVTIVFVLVGLFCLFNYNFSHGAMTGSSDYGSSKSSESGSSKTLTKFERLQKKATALVKKAKKLEAKNKIEKAKKNYLKAYDILKEANKIEPNNPDVLNYLGFTLRKTGDLKNAEIFYLEGLKLDATHPGINEYLGELYVETNRIELAKERLEALRDCNCEEFEELDALIKEKSN